MTESYKDLIARRIDLEKQIAEARKVELEQVLSKVRGLITEYELKPEDVFPAASRSGALKGRTVEPKYRDPASGATWTGRGKAPRWLDGKDKDSFRI